MSLHTTVVDREEFCQAMMEHTEYKQIKLNNHTIVHGNWDNKSGIFLDDASENVIFIFNNP